MPKMIFVNLPVADLARSIAFYEAIGAKRNPQFSDDTGACMVFSETIYLMILTHAKFQSFTPKAIADARATSEVLIALSIEERSAVDAMIDAAAGAGGQADPVPAQDHGFMYHRSFQDPDGHIWEPFWMDPAAVAGNAETQAA